MVPILRHSVIRKHVLRVDVLFCSYTSIEIEDQPAVNGDQLTASIGGALSLWMGITTAFLTEIIELLYNVVV